MNIKPEVKIKKIILTVIIILLLTQWCLIDVNITGVAPGIMHNAVIHATTLKRQCWPYHEHAPNTEHTLQSTQVHHLSGLPVPPTYPYIFKICTIINTHTNYCKYTHTPESDPIQTVDKVEDGRSFKAR